MTVREYLKAMKKAAKKRNIIDNEIVPYYGSNGMYMFVKVRDSETDGIIHWKFGYDQKDGEIVPFIKP